MIENNIVVLFRILNIYYVSKNGHSHNSKFFIQSWINHNDQDFQENLDRLSAPLEKEHVYFDIYNLCTSQYF